MTTQRVESTTFTPRVGTRARLRSEESGAAIVVVAVGLLLIMGMVALAIDGGRAYNERRADQNVADLSALAGAWAKCNGDSVVPAVQTAAATNGIPASALTIDENYGPNAVEVQVDTVLDGQVSPVIGADTVAVAARAVAGCEIVPGSGGNLPFGSPGGGLFDGILQTPGGVCSTGNCREVELPRTDSNSGANRWFIRNIALGGEPELVPHWGPDPGFPVCAPGMAQCTVIPTKTGVNAGPISDGLVRGSNSAAVDGRLENLASAVIPPWTSLFTNGGREIDADPHDQILQGAAGPNCLPPPGSCVAPPFDDTWIGLASIRTKVVGDGWDSDLAGNIGWIEEVHGDFMTIAPSVDRHVLYDGVVNKCESPRVANIPILTDDLDWAPGDPITFTFLGASDPAKVIGFYDIVIDAPRTIADFQGGNSDTMQSASAWIVWYGPNATCVGGGTPGGSGSPDSILIKMDE